MGSRTLTMLTQNSRGSLIGSGGCRVRLPSETLH
jgi:hypothetical protein